MAHACLRAGCSLARWEQALGGAGEAQERAALLGVLAREQAMCEVRGDGLGCAL